jgi:hypothetical protein
MESRLIADFALLLFPGEGIALMLDIGERRADKDSDHRPAANLGLMTHSG